MAFGKLDARLNALSKAPQAKDCAPAKKRKPRKEDRHATYKFGKIRAPNFEMPCAVLDMSPTGARVKTEGAVPLPKEVLLVVPDMAYKKKCLVAWQDGDTAGLTVEPPPLVR